MYGSLLRRRYSQIMQQVTESLAGRAAILRLLPMSQREISRTPDKPFAWETRLTPPVLLHERMPLPFLDYGRQFYAGGILNSSANPNETPRNQVISHTAPRNGQTPRQFQSGHWQKRDARICGSPREHDATVRRRGNFPAICYALDG